MFKHKTNLGDNEKVPSIMEKTGQPPTAFEPANSKDTSASALRDLMEKNLKWSQILYEQNRKINRKLFWYSVAGWIRTLFIVVPIILALLFLPPAYREFKKQYGSLFDSFSTARTSTAPTNLEEVLKVLPLNDAERERLKDFLK